MMKWEVMVKGVVGSGVNVGGYVSNPGEGRVLFCFLLEEWSTRRAGSLLWDSERETVRSIGEVTGERTPKMSASHSIRGRVEVFANGQANGYTDRMTAYHILSCVDSGWQAGSERAGGPPKGA